MAANGNRVKIGLLAPYSGTNLGDGAVQDAVLVNLSKRIDTAEFYGITLYPKETAKRHGISAFPITGLAVEGYSSHKTLFAEDNSPSRSEPSGNSATQLPDPARINERELTLNRRGIVDGVKDGLKKTPILGKCLSFMMGRFRETRNITREIGHLIRTYFFVRKLDLVIVSGSGQLTDECGGPWGHPYALFRWALLAKLAKTRFAVASVGTCRLTTALGRYFVRTALATACYRSYRDQGSKLLLNGWRFTSLDPCVPDMGFSLDLSRYHLDGALDTRETPTRLVAISPISYGNPECSFTSELHTYHRYLDALTSFTYWLIERGYEALLFVSSSSDRSALTDLTNRLTTRYGQNLVSHLAAPPVNRFQDLLTEVAKADFVVASRLHGVLLSHLLLKPVLAISWDRKVDAHMENIQQLPYRLDIHEVTECQLTECFGRLEASAPQIRANVKTRIGAFRALVDMQYDRLLRYATTQPSSGFNGKQSDL